MNKRHVQETNVLVRNLPFEVPTDPLLAMPDTAAHEEQDSNKSSILNNVDAGPAGESPSTLIDPQPHAAAHNESPEILSSMAPAAAAVGMSPEDMEFGRIQSTYTGTNGEYVLDGSLEKFLSGGGPTEVPSLSAASTLLPTVSLFTAVSASEEVVDDNDSRPPVENGNEDFEVVDGTTIWFGEPSKSVVINESPPLQTPSVTQNLADAIQPTVTMDGASISQETTANPRQEIQSSQPIQAEPSTQQLPPPDIPAVSTQEALKTESEAPVLGHDNAQEIRTAPPVIDEAPQTAPPPNAVQDESPGAAGLDPVTATPEPTPMSNQQDPSALPVAGHVDPHPPPPPAETVKEQQEDAGNEDYDDEDDFPEDGEDEDEEELFDEEAEEEAALEEELKLKEQQEQAQKEMQLQLQKQEEERLEQERVKQEQLEQERIQREEAEKEVQRQQQQLEEEMALQRQLEQEQQNRIKEQQRQLELEQQQRQLELEQQQKQEALELQAKLEQEQLEVNQQLEREKQEQLAMEEELQALEQEHIDQDVATQDTSEDENNNDEPKLGDEQQQQQQDDNVAVPEEQEEVTTQVPFEDPVPIVPTMEEESVTESPTPAEDLGDAAASPEDAPGFFGGFFGGSADQEESKEPSEKQSDEEDVATGIAPPSDANREKLVYGEEIQAHPDADKLYGQDYNGQPEHDYNVDPSNHYGLDPQVEKNDNLPVVPVVPDDYHFPGTENDEIKFHDPSDFAAGNSNENAQPVLTTEQQHNGGDVTLQQQQTADNLAAAAAGSFSLKKR